jgi:peptidoglycan hydrolase FlgJ
LTITLENPSIASVRESSVHSKSHHSSELTLGVARTASACSEAGVKKAHRDFESFVLQSFIEAMLPKEATAVFGQGIAGETWKSMLAEKLAKEVSLSGLTGLAQQIAGAAPGVAQEAAAKCETGNA